MNGVSFLKEGLFGSDTQTLGGVPEAALDRARSIETTSTKVRACMLDSLRRIANITSSHQAINNNNIKATHEAAKLGSRVCV